MQKQIFSRISYKGNNNSISKVKSKSFVDIENVIEAYESRKTPFKLGKQSSTAGQRVSRRYHKLASYKKSLNSMSQAEQVFGPLPELFKKSKVIQESQSTPNQKIQNTDRRSTQCRTRTQVSTECERYRRVQRPRRVLKERVITQKKELQQQEQNPLKDDSLKYVYELIQRRVGKIRNKSAFMTQRQQDQQFQMITKSYQKERRMTAKSHNHKSSVDQMRGMNDEESIAKYEEKNLHEFLYGGSDITKSQKRRVEEYSRKSCRGLQNKRRIVVKTNHVHQQKQSNEELNSSNLQQWTSRGEVTNDSNLLTL